MALHSTPYASSTFFHLHSLEAQSAQTVSHCRMHMQLTPSELGGGPTANDYCSAALKAELIEINGAIAIDVKAPQRLLRDVLTHGTFCSA